MKEFLKKILPFAVSKNQRYDRQTKKVIKKVCSRKSSFIDIGAHKGEILDEVLRYAPKGNHFAFEPIPDLHTFLKVKYSEQENIQIYQVALSNTQGVSSFNHVLSNPSYSGLIKRDYDRKNEKDVSIEVDTNTLDNLIPSEQPIDLIKIDVEGGEYPVLLGAKESITRSTPIIIFEHGLGASEYYKTEPEHVFEFFRSLNYRIATMELWLKGEEPFSLEVFKSQFYDKLNYYFIAYPA